jgi:hypothetical protein
MVRSLTILQNVSPDTGTTYTVSSGNCPSFSCATSFSCLLRGRLTSFQDGVAVGEGFLCAPCWGVQICDHSAAWVSCTVKDAPHKRNITRWYRQFVETGCLCKGSSPGRPRVSDENIERVLEAFQRSPRKSVAGQNRELGMAKMTVWKVLLALVIDL